MKKAIKLILIAIVFALFCLVPIQHDVIAHGNDIPSIAMDNQLVNDRILHTDESSQKVFDSIPYIILGLLIYFTPQVQFKRFTHSYIPLLKHLYLLFPVLYKSRYLVRSQFI